MPLNRDSVLGTFVIATILCIACSVVVAGMAVSLDDKITGNEQTDKQKNVLLAAGLCDKSASASEVAALFKSSIRKRMVNLATGQIVPEGEVPPGYDAEKAAKDAATQVEIMPPDALMGVRHRAPLEPVYEIVDGDQVQGYIFPVQGKGLWSTLKGFLAMEADGVTVRGITFYSHKETPGLGGEVDNATWKAKWKGKQVYDASGAVALDVVKGAAANDYQVDGLSGATITSNGVDGIVDYWLGPNGFGPYLKSQTGTAG